MKNVNTIIQVNKKQAHRIALVCVSSMVLLAGGLAKAVPYSYTSTCGCEVGETDNYDSNTGISVCMGDTADLQVSPAGSWTTSPTKAPVKTPVKTSVKTPVLAPVKTPVKAR